MRKSKWGNHKIGGKSHWSSAKLVIETEKMDRRKFIAHSFAGAAGLTFIPNISLADTNNIHFNPRNNGIALLDGNRNVLNPMDNGKALINPSMGWTLHYYDNNIRYYGDRLEPSDTMDDFPGLSTVYLRLPWSFIEPEEGKFQWEILDTPAQRWIDKGKKVALRITASEPMMRWATPEWVAKAGAKGYEWGKGRNLNCWGETWKSKESLWEPVYDDPIFFEKAESFIKAMATRYDDNSNISFIDIGHFGLWGEGHTVNSTKIDYHISVLRQHIDLYCKHFKKTQLCISDDYAGYNKLGYRFPITDYAFSKGVTIRDDSIMVGAYPIHWRHDEMAQLFWHDYPVILETDHYGSGLKKGTWKDDLFIKSVEEYHASYMSIHWWPKEFLESNREVIDKINLRLGYRLNLKSIEWPEKIAVGEPFEITQSWANVGVAPCYQGGYPCITLKDEKGGIISVLADKTLNVKALQVWEPQKEIPEKIMSTFTVAAAFKDPVKTFFRAAKSGKYDVYVSVGKEDGTPVFELPYNGNDGQKRYKMGQIEVLDRGMRV